MKVKAIADSGKDLSITSLNIFPYRSIEEKFQLNIGDQYTVYGICMFMGTLDYLTFDKWGNAPFWTPVELFEITDNRLPPEWYFTFYGYSEKQKYLLNALWGYKEMVFNPDHYDQLMERYPEAILIFNQRKIEIDKFHEL